MEATVHVGSKLFPQIPLRSLAEMSLFLLKALGLTASAEGISIPPSRYRYDQYVLAFDLEKVASDASNVSYTGQNTSSGNSIIRLEMKNINSNADNPAASQVVDRVYMTLVHSVKNFDNAEWCLHE